MPYCITDVFYSAGFHIRDDHPIQKTDRIGINRFLPDHAFNEIIRPKKRPDRNDTYNMHSKLVRRQRDYGLLIPSKSSASEQT